RLPVQALGLGIVAGLVTQRAQVRQHAIAGRDPQRLPERRLRLGLAAGGQADAAQAAPGLGFARLQLGGLAVGRDGLVEVPAGVLLVADLAIGIAIARAQRQRAPQVFQRQVGAAIAA